MKHNWLRLLICGVMAIGAIVQMFFERIWRQAAEWVQPRAAPILRPVARWVAPRLRADKTSLRARINQPTGPPRFAVAA